MKAPMKAKSTAPARAEADDAQCHLRRFDHALHRPLGVGRKRGKDQPLYNEDQSKRGQKVIHTSRAALLLGNRRRRRDGLLA